MPWKVLGAQVDAVGGSHGDRVGGSVSHSSLVTSNIVRGCGSQPRHLHRRRRTPQMSRKRLASPRHRVATSLDNERSDALAWLKPGSCRKTGPALLFLDVDGVLNTGSVTYADTAALKIENWPHALDLALLRRLKSVQRQTEALFVLSSTWRDNDLGKRLLAIGFAAVGISCDVVAGATPLLGQPRIDEIKKWLADHAPACKRWVAVDALNLLEDAPGLGAHIVHTSLTEGLTSDAAKECVAKLAAVQALSPSPPPPPGASSRAAAPRVPPHVLPLQRQESTAEERIEWAGRPGAAAAGARAACGWGSHAALAELGAAYARKRLRSEQLAHGLSKQMITDASDLSLAHRLVSSVLAQLTQRTQRTPAGAASPSLRGPTATQQLLALLSAAVPQGQSAAWAAPQLGPCASSGHA